MAQNFVTSDIVAKETLWHLENDLVMAKKINIDHSDKFVEIGDTVNVRKPVRFLGQEDNLNITGIREEIKSGKVPIKMDNTITVPFKIDPLDMTLEVSSERFQERYIKPAVTRMKDSIERKIGLLYKEVFHYTGTPGTIPATFKSLGANRVVLTNAAVPQSNRCGFHNPETALELADGLKNVYVEGKAKTAFEEAQIGRYAGFQNMESVHVPTHTVGDYGGTPLVAGADQNVTYESVKDTGKQDLATDGWSTSTTGLLKEGDVLRFTGVYAVNPVSKESTGRLQDFVVRADVDSDGSGAATISISPAIIVDGAYQTVTAAPADNAAITVATGDANSEHVQSLMMHPNAFTLVTRPLAISKAGLKTKTVQGNRMTISVTEHGDFDTLAHEWRLDCLFGLDCVYPELASRLTG